MAEAAVIDPSHRPLGIASDDSNPNFVGAHNPDANLWVKFYTKPVPNQFKTLEQGRPIFEDRLFVKIQIPGNQLSIIDTFAQEHHKRRFPMQWQHFLNTNGDDTKEIGTPLSAWPLLRPAQIEELRALKFRTVEQIAFASDQQLQSIGMAGGMAPMALRDRAKNYLDAASGEAVAAKAKKEADELRAQLETERKAREEMEAKHAADMEEVRAMVEDMRRQQAPKTDRKAKE